MPDFTISVVDAAIAQSVLDAYAAEASVAPSMTEAARRVAEALSVGDTIHIKAAEVGAITPTPSTPTSIPTPPSAQRDEGAAPRLRVCVIRVDEGFGPGGSDEVWFAPRSGLYRVLDLLGDPVDASLDKFSIEALEQYCDLVASKADTSGAVQWTFAPVMDAHVS